MTCAQEDPAAEQATFWAGPGLVTTPGPDAEPPTAVLVLWRQPPAPEDGPDGHGKLSTLLERGFGRLADPAPAQLRRLPLLDEAVVRLSTDGHHLHLDDRGATLFEGDLTTAPDHWWATAQEGPLVVLVDTAPVPDQAAPEIDGTRHRDLSEWAAARLTAACAAGVVVGARVDVATDP